MWPILVKFTRMGHIQWPHFTRMGHIQCPHFTRMRHIQWPHFTRMGHIQYPHSKTATGKPFAQRWILGRHRIPTPAMTVASLPSKLGRIVFTMLLWQAMFYRGHRASLCSVNKQYSPPSIVLKWGIFQCLPFY